MDTEIWVHHEAGSTMLDDTTRTAVDYDLNGVDSPRRPYTAEENAAADIRQAARDAEANRIAIEQSLNEALATLQALLDTPNSVIKSDPQTYIKDMARIMKRQIRLQIRRLDGTS
jgi:hypothetical protein